MVVLDGYDRSNPADKHLSLEKPLVVRVPSPSDSTVVGLVKTALAVADRNDNLAVEDIRSRQQHTDDQGVVVDYAEDTPAQDGKVLKLPQYPCSIHRRPLYWHVSVFELVEALSCCQSRR